MTNTEPVYRIKPLVWKSLGSQFPIVAETPCGDIYGAHEYFWYFRLKGQASSPDYHVHSMAEAKAAAEAHWRDRIKQALEEVK